MNARIALVAVSLALSVLIGLTLRGGGDTKSAEKRLVIGFSMDTLKEARWQRDRDYFVAKAKALGAEVLVQSANSDDTRQMQDVQALLSAGVSVLVIVPHNGDAMKKAVELAHEQHVPVIAYDRLITGTDLDLYVSFDPVRIGEVQAQYLVDHLGAQKRIVRIHGASTDQNAHFMKQGQDKVLQPLIASKALAIVHEDWAENWKPEQAKKITNAAITKHGKTIDAVLAANDGTAGGAIQALTEEGLAGKIVVTGQDAELVACQRIAQGSQLMTIYKPLEKLAATAAELAVKLALGRPVVAKGSLNNGRVDVPAVLLDVVVVDKDNLKSTVVKDGFHAEKDVFP